MKSKVRIDVDYDNLPVVQLDYEHSDDVRDKLVQKFGLYIPATGGFCFANKDEGGNTKIRPINNYDITALKWAYNVLGEMIAKEELEIKKANIVDTQVTDYIYNPPVIHDGDIIVKPV